MNVAQYSPNKRMEREAIGSIDTLPSVKESLQDSAIPGRSSRREDDVFVEFGSLVIPADRTGGDQGPGEGPGAASHLGMKATSSQSADSATLEFGIDEAGGAHIVKCTTDASHLEVPDTIDGHVVTVVGHHAFSTCYCLESVVLPDSVREISEHAFMNTALRAFKAPRCLRVIRDRAFLKCSQLIEMELDEGLESIGEGAFRETALAELVIPAHVIEIGRDISAETPLVVTGDSPTLRIDDANERFGLDGGVLYEVRDDGLVIAQVLDEGIEEFSCREHVVHVADQAFAGRRRLRCATFPEGLISIGEAAFKGCCALERVDLPDSLRSIGRRAFWGTSLASLYIPAALEAVGAAAFYTGDTVARNFLPSIKNVSISPENKRFFLEDDALCHRRADGRVEVLLYFGAGERVRIPRGATHIGPYAYMNSAHVKELTIHDGLEGIDVGGLDFGKATPIVVYEVGGDKPERYVIEYPPGEAGRQTMRITFGLGTFDVAVAYSECDSAIMNTRDTFTRSRMMVERLANPVYLSKKIAVLFRNRVATILPAVVVEFGKNGYLEGIDKLLDLGILDEGNIQEVVDAAVAADEVATASRLMDIQRTQFGLPMFDFDL